MTFEKIRRWMDDEIKIEEKEDSFPFQLENPYLIILKTLPL